MVTLYVEGGGDSKQMRITCRAGFSAFLEKAGLKGHMPRISACGGRQNAFESYCTAIEHGDSAVLLVDSEAPVLGQYQVGDEKETWQPWQHLKQRQGDGWDKPVNSVDTDCHLMVQCMESWFLADRATLTTFFGQGFHENSLPAAGNAIESVSKQQVYQSLANATKACKTKAPYGKGEHSFKLLALITPTTVTAASPWAGRFVKLLKAKLGVA